jgi:GNAT superfamily N-acetyltransferase
MPRRAPRCPERAARLWSACSVLQSVKAAGDHLMAGIHAIGCHVARRSRRERQAGMSASEMPAIVTSTLDAWSHACLARRQTPHKGGHRWFVIATRLKESRPTQFEVSSPAGRNLRHQRHLAILRGSYRVVLALEDERVVGFVAALSDGVLCAHVSLLEVLPEYRGQGVGTELVRRVINALSDLYAIDVLCDPELQAFYERLGLRRAVGMMARRYEHQAGMG